MFVQDRAGKDYLRAPRKRHGWGRVAALTVGLLVLSAHLAYGAGSGRVDRVVVAPGDTLWSIAQAHYAGDPRPHVETILQLNHLTSPLLLPGQTIAIPVD